MQADLKDMPYANGAGYNPEKECLPNTRLAVIEMAVDWACNPPDDDDTRLLWLTGVAGCGKTSIAHSIARIFKNQKRLGSFFAFDIGLAGDRSAEQLFSTIAVDLADLDRGWKSSLWNLVKNDRSLRTTCSIQQQFSEFVLKTSLSAGLTVIGPIVIMIDALDESGDQDLRNTVLDVLAHEIPKLPNNFRIILTSRPEQDIRDALALQPHVCSKSIKDIDRYIIDRDIRSFIQSQLEGLSTRNPDWPDIWLSRLVEKSERLFQWASTACAFIRQIKGGSTSTERLHDILSSSVTTLDSLYSTILERMFDSNNETTMKRFREVLGSVIYAVSPFSMSLLEELLSAGNAFTPAMVSSVLAPLGSLLSGVGERNIAVFPLHTSFHDFLRNSDRSGCFHIEPRFGHAVLLGTCMRAMRCGLRFNICNFETSYLMNEEVADLKERIKKNIPHHLSYASSWWVLHAHALPCYPQIVAPIFAFLKECLLYWIEAAALLGKLPSTLKALQIMYHWNDAVSLTYFFAFSLTRK